MRAIALAASIAIAVAGCGATGPQPNPVVRLELGDEVMATTGATTVTITLENPGDPSMVLADQPCSAMGFQVTDPRGAVVYPTGPEPDCVMTLDAPARVPVGEHRLVVHRWAAVEGYGALSGAGDPLGPGVYRVTPVVELEGRTVHGEAVELRITM